ncbi:MAG: cyclic nucleotide-binding domain-containing protein [Chromatiales bacterium]|nr:cyclic nucleotide-binding domain-containing protein [Chromatiales bacterium]
MKTLEQLIAEQPLFADLGPDFQRLLAGCARNVRFSAGSYLFREGDPADSLYLLREGRVALEAAAPGRGALDFLSVGPGEIVGVSWLVPPYRWAWDARATTDTRGISFDATCVRAKCEADPALGYALMKRFLPVLLERLHAVRWQVLDVYGSAPES